MEYMVHKRIYYGTVGYACTFAVIAFSGMISFNPVILTSISALNLTATSAILILWNKFFDMKNCTEFKELNAIFEEIKKDIFLKKDILEIKRAAEIYAYLLFLLKEGYLSYDLTYGFDGGKTIIDDKSILSACCLNNHSVCRHKANFLKEMYAQSNIESTTFIGHLDNSKDLHAITDANEDGVSYLLDPEWGTLFYKADDGRYVSFRQTHFRYGHQKNLKSLSYYQPPLLEEVDAFYRSMSDAYKKMMLNRDVFDKFYKENKEKLEEAERVYQKLLKNN